MLLTIYSEDTILCCVPMPPVGVAGRCRRDCSGGDVMAMGESWGFDNRVFIESVFVQNDLSEGLEPLDAGTGENQG